MRLLCRCCSATPEQVLRRAIAMPRIRAARDPIAAGLRFAIRWRDTLRGKRDLVCGFCQLWAARLAGIVLEDLVVGGARAVAAAPPFVNGFSPKEGTAT